MVKTDSKRLNVRLKTAARYALEDLAERWNCSQTAALERAILEAHQNSSAQRRIEPGVRLNRPDFAYNPETDLVEHRPEVPELKVEYDAE